MSSTDETRSIAEDEAAGGPPVDSRPLIDLDKEGLFATHVVALLKKRGSYFRRDKKAWICTTIVPSLFVLVGFSVFRLTQMELNMPPLNLSLEDFNPSLGVSTIPFNSPDDPFLCQPGVCSHKDPLYVDKLTNEKYIFCGYEAKLGASLDGFNVTNQTCTNSDSADVMSGIFTGNALPDEAGVRNVTEVRNFMLLHYFGTSRLNQSNIYLNAAL